MVKREIVFFHLTSLGSDLRWVYDFALAEQSLSILRREENTMIDEKKCQNLYKECTNRRKKVIKNTERPNMQHELKKQNYLRKSSSERSRGRFRGKASACSMIKREIKKINLKERGNREKEGGGGGGGRKKRGREKEKR
jgi:hypothetical protein